MDNIKNMKILFFCFLFSITGIFILYIPSYFTPKKEIKYKEIERNLAVIDKNVIENKSPLKSSNKYEITYSYINDRGEWVNFTDEVTEEVYNNSSIGDHSTQIIRGEVKD